MIENRALVYIGDFGRLLSTGRAVEGVLNVASTPFQGGGKQCNDSEKRGVLVYQ